MARYYELSRAASQAANTTANTQRAVMGFPIANTTGLSEAFGESFSACEAQEARTTVQVQLQIVRVALADIPSGGTTLGTAVALDPSPARVAVVGASTTAKYDYADAAVSNTTVLGTYSFAAEYGLILPPSICNKWIWGPNQALLVLYSHGSGSAALKMDYTFVWGE